jgi:hypothetical protein
MKDQKSTGRCQKIGNGRIDKSEDGERSLAAIRQHLIDNPEAYQDDVFIAFSIGSYQDLLDASAETLRTITETLQEEKRAMMFELADSFAD